MKYILAEFSKERPYELRVRFHAKIELPNPSSANLQVLTRTSPQKSNKAAKTCKFAQQQNPGPNESLWIQLQ